MNTRVLNTISPGQDRTDYLGALDGKAIADSVFSIDSSSGQLASLPSKSRPVARRLTTHLLVALISLVAIGGSVAITLSSQAQTTQKAELSYRSTIQSAAGFISTFLHQRASEQSNVAQNPLYPNGQGSGSIPGYLAGPFVDQGVFNEFASSLGMDGAVITSGSDIVTTYPESFGLILLSEYSRSQGSGSTNDMNSYLEFPRSIATALKQDRPAISNAKLVAVDGVHNQAVIVISSPYQTFLKTTRVVTGYYAIARTPLGPFIDQLHTSRFHGTYLVDKYGNVIVSSPNMSTSSTIRSLASEDPKLARLYIEHKSGSYKGPSGLAYYYSSVQVPGTQWHLVGKDPVDVLVRHEERGNYSAAEWAAVIVFSLAVLLADYFLYRYLRERDRLSKLSKELDLVSRLDVLTGLYNRRHIDEQLKMLVASARRYEHPIGFLICDIDHFKAVNDTHGHEAGDKVLEEFSKRLSKAVRPGDLIGRWGGEEFVAVLPMTDIHGAREVAERVREKIASEPFVLGNGHELVVTVSIGCSSQMGNQIIEDRLIKLADDALYLAKEGGRNRVEVSNEIGVSRVELAVDQTGNNP